MANKICLTDLIYSGGFGNVLDKGLVSVVSRRGYSCHGLWSFSSVGVVCGDTVTICVIAGVVSIHQLQSLNPRAIHCT